MQQATPVFATARAWSSNPVEDVLVRRVSVCDPTDARELHRLGVMAGRHGKHADAVRMLSRAAELKPQEPSMHNDLGVALEHAGKLTEAAACYRRALELMPRFFQVRTNLANALLHAGDLPEALRTAREAVADGPAYAPALNTLGCAWLDDGEPAAACDAFRQAVRIQNDFAQAHANLGLALLMLGRFEEGWREHEWRPSAALRTGPSARSGPELPGRRWTGQDIFGHTILLYGEGGLGNVIQFARYVPVLAKMGARVAVECRPQLVELLKTLPGVWRVAPHEQNVPGCDLHCPLMSLPAVLKTAIETVANSIPYLHPPQELIEKWRGVLEARRLKARATIGVCWQGEQKLVHMRNRSFPPQELRPLARAPGITLISLQHGAEVPDGMPIKVLPGLDHESMTFLDAAAVMKSLDLVVTCDTSIAHLAGALGVPVSVALRHSSDWRWMLGRQDSPWYPSMRLFRQERRDAWGPVFARIAVAG